MTDISFSISKKIQITFNVIMGLFLFCSTTPSFAQGHHKAHYHPVRHTMIFSTYSYPFIKNDSSHQQSLHSLLGHSSLPSVKKNEATPANMNLTSTRHVQRGIASWYGPGFNGRKTANGERYNMYDLTAASLSLPLGSYARVTNMRNGKQIIVKINDHGPYVHPRIIDLSFAAAQKLGVVNRGTELVQVELLKNQTSAMAEGA